MKLSKADFESYKKQVEAEIKVEAMGLLAKQTILQMLEKELKKFPKPKDASLHVDKGNKGQS